MSTNTTTAINNNGEGNKLTKRDLFGGAISCAIPMQWRDVSNVRQVPDHQEVYQDCTNTTSTSSDEYIGTGGCLIVEILQRQDDVDDIDAAKFFFDDLADANGCESAELHGRHLSASQVVTVGSSATNKAKEEEDSSTNLVPNLSETIHTACTCIGYQRIAMGRDYDVGGRDRTNEQEVRTTKIELCVLRLEDVHTDLLITLTMPVAVSLPSSSSSNDANDEGAAVLIGMNQGLEESKQDSAGDSHVGHDALFRKILRSFVVNDWTLFG